MMIIIVLVIITVMIGLFICVSNCVNANLLTFESRKSRRRITVKFANFFTLLIRIFHCPFHLYYSLSICCCFLFSEYTSSFSNSSLNPLLLTLSPVCLLFCLCQCTVQILSLNKSLLFFSMWYEEWIELNNYMMLLWSLLEHLTVFIIDAVTWIIDWLLLKINWRIHYVEKFIIKTLRWPQRGVGD